MLDILQHLDRQKYELVVICNEEGHYVSDFQQHARRTYPINWELPLPLLWLRIRRILRKEQPQYVHNHLWKACFAGTLAALGLGHRQIYNNLHGEISSHTTYNRLKIRFYQWLNWLLSKTGSTYLCISKNYRQQLRQQGIAPSQLLLHYNWVDCEYFTPTPGPDSRDPLRLLCISRLHEEKGIRTLLRAARQFPAHWQLTLVGDGPLTVVFITTAARRQR